MTLCNLAALVFALSLGAFSARAACPSGPPMSVRFYDVGQGLAVLVTLPDGRHIIIDSGPPVAHDLVPRLKRDLNRLRNEDFEYPDLLGAAYEYLIRDFADSAGKKGGEFYTPALSFA